MENKDDITVIDPKKKFTTAKELKKKKQITLPWPVVAV